MATTQQTEATALQEQLTRQAEVSRLKDGLLIAAMGKPVRRVLRLDLFQDGPQVGVATRAINQLRSGVAPVRIEILDGVEIEYVQIYLQHVLDNLTYYTPEYVAGSVVQVVPRES